MKPLFSTLCIVLLHSTTVWSSSESPAELRALFAEHCIKCHGSSVQKAGRRLNRAELEYTLRDLLDIPWLEVKDLLPEDGRECGYTRSAAALDVSPIFLAKVGEAIDRALDGATAKYTAAPETTREKLYANQ